MEETAYAKLNLALHVRGREPDGYHRIETLFAFCEDGDRLRVEPGEGVSLRVEGPFSRDLPSGDDNLVLKAARFLRERVGGQIPGAALVLDKRLPVASGIGGGSADAAAALRLLPRWWGVAAAADIDEIARSLGADVPACILSASARGAGRGDVLEPVDLGLAGTPVLLVNPGAPLATGEVFQRWDGVDRGPLAEDFRVGRNDLEGPAQAIAPVIPNVLSRLRAAEGATLARMSGSGATCFALFDSEAARGAAARAIRSEKAGWWCLETCLR